MPDISALINSLDAMPHGSAQAEAARSLWNLTQQEKDASIRFKALASIMQAANFSGAPDFFVSLLPHLVDLKKNHPEAVDLHIYVWRLKWLTSSLFDFPEIPLHKINMGFSLYQEALREIGGNERTLLYLKWKQAYISGLFDAARQLRESFTTMKRDSNADCLACEINSLVTEAVFEGDHTRALKSAEPIMSGRMRCASVPHSTYANLLLPFLFNGDSQKAERYQRLGYSLVRSNVGEVDNIGDHLAYLAAVGNDSKCLRLMRAHLPWLEHNFNPSHHLDFFYGAAAAMRMISDAGSRKRALRLPLSSKLEKDWDGSTLRVEEFADRFEDEAHKLANAFDRRDETTWHLDRLKRSWNQIHGFRRARL